MNKKRLGQKQSFCGFCETKASFSLEKAPAGDQLKLYAETLQSKIFKNWGLFTNTQGDKTVNLGWYILAVVGGAVFYRDDYTSAIPRYHLLIAIALIINGLFLSFKVSPYMLKREKDGHQIGVQKSRFPVWSCLYDEVRTYFKEKHGG